MIPCKKKKKAQNIINVCPETFGFRHTPTLNGVTILSSLEQRSIAQFCTRVLQLLSNERGTHTRTMRHALHPINDWADNDARKWTLRYPGWCHSDDKVLATIAATSRWVMHCDCRSPAGWRTHANICHNCSYETTAAALNAHHSHHTRTANSRTEGHRSNSWQLTGSISLLLDRPLHTL